MTDDGLAGRLRGQLAADEAAWSRQPGSFRRDQVLLVLGLRGMLVEVAAGLPARFGRPLLQRAAAWERYPTPEGS